MQSSSEHQVKFSKLLPALFSIGHPVNGSLHNGDRKTENGRFWVFLESGVFIFSAY